MADDLKRVGLVFKEDGAVDFRKTLQEINLELNKNYNQFKLTQAQWDNSTTSTQKLRAEQEYLKNAYETQEDKVKTLKMQLSDLENAEEKNTTAIKKKRNELTTAEVKLESYNKRIKEIETQLNNTGKKIEEFGKNAEKLGEKMEKAGKKMSAFSAASTAALVASAKSAIDFEEAFTGVEKTVDGTEQQMAELKQGIRDMAKEIPSTTTEISAVAEAAGQLGIKTENILSFSKAMIDLGNSTNLTADEAASQLAKFANVMQMSQSDFDRLGSSIVHLGNNFATTEADIVNMAMRLAGAGKQVGLSEGQVLGLATALSSVGIEAEMGGSAISKAMVKMQNAVEMGGEKLNKVLDRTGMTLRDLELMAANDSMGFKEMAQSLGMTSTELKQLITAGTNLEDFAKVSGMTAEEFKRAWKEDAAGALGEFIKGLGNAEEKGESAITMLSEMGLTEVRLRDSLLRAANAGNLFNEAIETGTKAWEDNTALTNEANKRYGTLKSQITVAINKLKDIAITIGNKLMPYISKLIDGIEGIANWFSNLNDEQMNTIVNIGLVVAAIGPLLTIFGKVTSTVGGVIKGIGTFSQAIGVLKGTVTSTDTAVNGLSKVIGGLTSPTGLAIAGITALVGTVIYFATQETEAQKRVKELANSIVEAGKSLDEYNAKVDETASIELSHIDNIQKLKNELDALVDENGKVQKSDEGRANFIINQLNDALGTEIKLTDGQIQNYKDLQTEVDKLIEKKRAEIVLAAEEEKYKYAIENREQATKNLKETLSELGMTYDEAKEKAEEYYQKMQDGTLTFEDLQNSNFGLIASFAEADEQVRTYTEEVKQYEEDYAKFTEGKYNEIGQAIKTSTKDWTDNTLQEISDSIKTQKEELDLYKQIYEATGDEIAKQSYEQAQKNLDNLTAELHGRTTTINTMSKDEIKAWATLAQEDREKFNEEMSKTEGDTLKQLQTIAQVIDQNKNIPSNEMDALAELMEGSFNSMDSSKWGTDLIQGLASGIRQKTQTTLKTAVKEAANAISGFLHFSRPDEGPLREYEKWMPDMVKGLSDSLRKASPELSNATESLADEMSEKLSTIEPGSNINAINGSASGNIIKVDIDYPKLINSIVEAIIRALTNCKFTLDEDGFAKIVKDELYKVV